MKIILGLLLTTLCSCNNWEKPQNDSDFDNKQYDNFSKNISSINARFQIDTIAILNNENLQHLISDLEKAKLNEKNTVEEIPNFIKSFLDSLTDNFSITNPGDEWQNDCIIRFKQNEVVEKIYDTALTDTLTIVSYDSKETLPLRQLKSFWSGRSIALMTYYTGGWGIIEHIIIIKYDNKKIIDFWCGNLRTNLGTQEEILKYLIENKDEHWGLNTNILYI